MGKQKKNSLRENQKTTHTIVRCETKVNFTIIVFTEMTNFKDRSTVFKDLK